MKTSKGGTKMSTMIGMKTMNVAVVTNSDTLAEEKYSLDLLGLIEVRNLYEKYRAEVIVF